MGPLIGSYRDDDKDTVSLPRTPHSRRTKTTDDGLMAFDTFSEFSFDDALTDEGRLSRSLQSWMPDYTIVPIEPMVKPPKQPVYSGRLGKKLSLKRIPSDESITTKLSLLSCSTRAASPEERSSTATKRRRKRKNLSSRAPSATEKVVSKWEEFARQRAKGALDKFSKTHNAMRMDVVQRFEDDESEAFRLMDKDEKKMLISVGITRSRLFAGQLKKTPSLSDVKDSFTPSPPRQVRRSLSAGAKPRSRGINLEEIRQQRMREKIALMQQRQRSRGGRRSFLSHRQLTRTTLTSSQGSVAPATPSPRSASPVNQEEKVSVWKGDTQILEMDLRRGLTKRVQKKIMSTTMAINTAYMGKELVQDLVGYLDINDAARAMAVTEVKLTDIPVGTSILTTWKGMPLFVRHRTEEEIKIEQSVDLLSLRDPQHDSDRSLSPEWMVLIGVCTHLGCIPLQDQGAHPGGMYCPCHGSHYDSSGRIRKGPAPLNLTVAPHKIKGDYLVVG